MALLSGPGGRKGWMGGGTANSDNEGGRAACKHPRRVGGLLLVPGGHGSGWVAVGRAGRGGRASRLGWLGWLGWWSCWSLGGRPRRAASSRLRAKLAYLSVLGGLGGLLVQLGALWWSFQRWYGPCVDGKEWVGGGGESGRWKCGGGNEMFGGHRCYSRKLNEKELRASPGELLFDGTRDGGTVYRVCLVSPRNASTGGRIRGWRGGRRAPGRPSIPIECGLARTVRWSTRVGCPRRAPPERPGRSSGQGGRGRERFAQSSITYAQFCRKTSPT